MDRKNNQFGKTLQDILLFAEMKNYSVAHALKYDVSYVSKWVSGAALPSKKNIATVCKNIGEIVSENCPSNKSDKLCNYLGMSEGELIEEAVEAALKNAYFDDAGEQIPDIFAYNASLRINPDGRRSPMADFVDEMDGEEPVDIGIMADFFSLGRAEKLALATIENNAFVMKKLHPEISVHFVLDLSKITGENDYDVVLLIHLLTGYSHAAFELTQSTCVDGKLAVVIKDRCASLAMLDGREGFFAVTHTRNKQAVSQIYQNIIDCENPEQTVFAKTTMETMLLHREYVQLMLSLDIRWLLGHITEQLISPELAKKLRKEIFADQPNVLDECEKAKSISGEIIKRSNTRILIYETALTNFMLTGELDFFNHKIILTPAERKEQLEYMLKTFDKHCVQNINIRMIKGGLSDDFRYITNPCLFISDSITYLRLENQHYTNNIITALDGNMKQIFNRFFEKIWNDRKDVVVTDGTTIINKLKQLIDATELLQVED